DEERVLQSGDGEADDGVVPVGRGTGGGVATDGGLAAAAAGGEGDGGGGGDDAEGDLAESHGIPHFVGGFTCCRCPGARSGAGRASCLLGACLATLAEVLDEDGGRDDDADDHFLPEARDVEEVQA